jgi:hypothetical protein
MFTYDRLSDQRSFTKEQLILKQYADSVLNLMKRNYKGGVTMLTKLIKGRSDVVEEYLGCCYAYRAFGFAALENHSKAVRNFRQA